MKKNSLPCNLEAKLLYYKQITNNDGGDMIEDVLFFALGVGATLGIELFFIWLLVFKIKKSKK